MIPTYIELTNFKSIGSEAQRIELAPITLLFGPNSAGKSTILQSLIYLKEILGNKNYDPDSTLLGGDWLDLGGFKNLVNGRGLDKNIEIAIGFKTDNTKFPDYLTEHESDEIEEAELPLPDEWLDKISSFDIKLSLIWSESLNKPIITSYETVINNKLFSRIESSTDGRRIYIDDLAFMHPVFYPGDLSDDETIEVDSLFDSFIDLFKPTMIDDSPWLLEWFEKENKPLKKHSVKELAKIIEDEDDPSLNLWGFVKQELLKRPSRQAAELLKKLNSLIDKAEKKTENIDAIGLDGQKDAMPNLVKGLQIASIAWSDTEVDDPLIATKRLLFEKLFSGMIVGTLSKLNDWLDSLNYIGPLRDLPSRNFQPKFTNNKSRWAKGLAAWEILQGLDKNTIDEINYWMGNKCLKTGFQVEVQHFRELPLDVPIAAYLDKEMDMDQQGILKSMIEMCPIKSRVTLKDERTGLDIMPQDIGVGISQLFPVVVLAITQKSGLMAIEQPELHIHPGIQVELADLFIRYAIKHNKFILLETHSEHLILRILRRIRENSEDIPMLDMDKISKDDVSVQYITRTNNGSLSERQYIDEDGDFTKDWPEGFFGERDDEMFF